MQEVSRKKALWREVGALVGLVGLPTVMIPVLYAPYSGMYHPSDPWVNIADGLRVLGITCFILFVLWASADRWATFGLRSLRARIDVPLILLLTALLVVTRWSPGTPAEWQEYRQAYAPVSIAVGASILFAVLNDTVFEELFFRGYLIPRIEELTGNVWIGVVGSGLFFGFTHLYQGAFWAFMATGMGLAFGIAFVKRRSIWPLVAAHSLYNFGLHYWW